MRIFVQYENHLLPLNIQLHDAIGSVSPLDFAATALEGKIRDGAFIFVILNHYPQLTEYTCKTHHAEFLQWKNRSLIPYDVSRLNYDPVLQTLNRRPAPAPAPVPTPAPVPASALVQVPAQPVSNLGISPGVYFQNPARPLLASPPRTPSISLPSVGSSVRRRSRSRSPPRPHLRSSVTPSQLISRPLLSLLSNDIPRNSLASNLRLASSNNPMSHAVQMRSPDHAIQPRIRPPLSSFSLSQPPLPPPLSSLSLPQRPSPLSSLSPLRPPPRRNDLDQIWSSLSNHLSGVKFSVDLLMYR